MRTVKTMHGLVLAFGLVFSAIAGAADFDGTAPLACTGLAGYSCDPDKACGKVKPESNVPPVVTIDPGNKTVQTPYRTDLLPIANSVLNNEQLQLQGTSEKFAWSAIVNRKSGKVTVTIADRVGAYVIFGQCKISGGT